MDRSSSSSSRARDLAGWLVTEVFFIYSLLHRRKLGTVQIKGSAAVRFLLAWHRRVPNHWVKIGYYALSCTCTYGIWKMFDRGENSEQSIYELTS
jgi:hypothetical protein